MILNALKSFTPAYKIILRDKVNLFLVLLPICIGILLYLVAGKAFFSYSLDMGNQLIESYISNEAFGGVLTFLVGSILSIFLFFIVNWTFILFLSVLASPFNDVLSSRVEKNYLNETLPSFKESFDGMAKNVLSIMLNETKKVLLIITLSLLAFLLSLFPVLLPLSIAVSVLLLAAGYIDYSWSRHDIHFSECKKDLYKNALSYIFAGAFFMIVVSIPIINILVPSMATSYFTILWIKNNEYSNQTSK